MGETSLVMVTSEMGTVGECNFYDCGLFMSVTSEMEGVFGESNF